MEDLPKSFFHRDLTDSEWDQLDALIESSPQAAFRFLKFSESYLREIGNPGGGSQAVGPWTGVLLGLLIGSVTTWFVLREPAEPMEFIQNPAVIDHSGGMRSKPLSTASPTVSDGPAVGFKEGKIRIQAKPSHTPDATSPSKKHDALSIIVDQAGNDLTTVRVLDGQGKEIRLLFAGLLPQGQRTFTWDGKSAEGLSAPPGFYTIEVQSSAGKFRKRVEIGVGY